jgi:prenyltransferase beta subunit
MGLLKRRKVTIGFVVIIVIVFMLALHFYHPSSMPVPEVSTKSLRALLGEQWVQDTAWFMEINYVEEEDTAWFGQFPKHNFQPNLYTTHQVILLLQNAGKSVDNAQGIIRWVNSIQQPYGTFDCPADVADHAPIMLETYWAVMIFKYLEDSPEHVDKIIDIILNLQKENGGFSLYPGGDADYQATVLASEILLFLGQDKLEKPLRDAADFLKQRLDIRLQQRTKAQAEKIEKLKDLLILRTILELTPNHILPEQFAPVIARAKTLIQKEDFIQETLFWPGFSFAHIANQLFDIALLGVDTGLDFDNIKNLTANKVFPKVPEEGPHLFQGIIDANLLTINDLMELAKNAGEPYPHVEEIIRKVNRYRIEGGWLTFVDLAPSIRSTYAALYVAGKIGYDQFDHKKVESFVASFIKNNNASFRERYYALMSFRLLENRSENELIRDFEESIIKQALQINNDLASLQCYAYLALIAKELNLEIPDPLRDKAKELLASLSMKWKNTPVVRMELLHAVMLTQHIAGEEIFPLSELREKLTALWSSQGGFKAAANFPSGTSIEVPAEYGNILIPDIPIMQSTYSAVQIMELLPSMNILNGEQAIQMKEYILHTKSKYGFDEVSAAMRDKHEKAIGLEPTWKSTMAALKILRFISDTSMQPSAS